MRVPLPIDIKPPILYMLVGLPYCGKSTWALKAPAHLINTDLYIEKMCLVENKKYHDIIHKYIKKASEEMDNSLTFFIGNEKSVVIDQTNLTVKSRKKKLDRFTEKYYKIAIVWQLELVEHIRRKEQRPDKFVPDKVLNRMSLSFEIPTLDEGFDLIVITNGDI